MHKKRPEARQTLLHILMKNFNLVLTLGFTGDPVLCMQKDTLTVTEKKDYHLGDVLLQEGCPPAAQRGKNQGATAFTALHTCAGGKSAWTPVVQSRSLELVSAQVHRTARMEKLIRKEAQRAAALNSYPAAVTAIAASNGTVSSPL